MATVQNRTLIAEALVKASADPDFKRALITDPVKTLRERGVEIPEGRTYEIHDNTANAFYIVVRYEPLEEALKLRTLPKSPSVTEIAQWVVTMVQENHPVAADLLADPVATARRLNIPVPDGMHVKVLRSTAEHQHLVIPYNPSARGSGTQELTDAQLDVVVGGKGVSIPVTKTSILVTAAVGVVVVAAVGVSVGVSAVAVVVP